MKNRPEKSIRFEELPEDVQADCGFSFFRTDDFYFYRRDHVTWNVTFDDVVEYILKFRGDKWWACLPKDDVVTFTTIRMEETT